MLRRRAAFVLVLLAAACTDDTQFAWRGEHITYVAEPATGFELCGGQVAFGDRLVTTLAKTWGPEGAPSSVELELRLHGTESLAGRASRGFAWAGRQPSVRHELAHVVTIETSGSSAAVFGEGIAELMAPHGLLEYYLPPLPPDEFVYLQRPEFSTAEYYDGAKLLSFLIRRNGLAAVRDAYEQVDPSSTPAEIDEAFITAFGDDVFDAFDEFETQQPCLAPLWQCNSEVVPLMELPFALDLDPRHCQDTDIPGFTTPNSDQWYPEHVGFLRLEEPRLIRYLLQNAILNRLQCQDTCTPLPEELLEPWPIDTLSSDLGSAQETGLGDFTRKTLTGEHYFEIRPLDPQQPFSVRITDEGPVPN